MPRPYPLDHCLLDAQKTLLSPLYVHCGQSEHVTNAIIEAYRGGLWKDDCLLFLGL